MKIEKLREKHELSQTQLAKRIGAPPSLICMIENGSRTPSFEFLQKCEKEFPGEVTVADYTEN